MPRRLLRRLVARAFRGFRPDRSTLSVKWPYWDVRAPTPLLRQTIPIIAGASVVVGVLILAITQPGTDFRLDLSLPLHWVGASLALAGALTIGLSVWLGEDRARAVLKRHNYALCTRCNYDLGAVPSPGRCPECGRAFEIEEVRERWAGYLRQFGREQLP